ncbi:hypothetical protein NFI96_003918 [Prochilodus magdalenae]|nr:hypothetical protein NFI96_003918 [Prochilodus magdalenae]
MLNIVAGGITFSTASPEPVTSVTCAQVKPALICEKHKAPMADLPILVFCGKCQSSSTVLANDFTLTGPRGDAVYQSPSVVTLSCHLSPEISAVDMEIWWFKGTACVCLYKNSQVTEGRGYEGRVGLLTHELQTGNVSLQIRDCKASDKGDYLCQVTNGDTTEECSIRVMEEYIYTSNYHFTQQEYLYTSPITLLHECLLTSLTIPLLTKSVS